MRHLPLFLFTAAIALIGLVAPADAFVIEDRPDMQCVSKTADTDALDQGVDTTVTYTVTIRNGGPVAAEGVIITDTLPVGADFVSASAGCTESSGTVTCNIGTVASGAQLSRQITVEFVDPQPQPSDPDYRNAANVSATNGDTSSGNNLCTHDLNVTETPPPQPDLACISKTVDLATLTIDGGSLTYVVTVKNNGPTTATGVTVTDFLDSNVTVTGAIPDNCSGTTGTIECLLGDLLAGDSDTLTLNVSVPPLAAGTIVGNSARVDGDQTDPTPDNNAGTQCAVETTIVDRGDEGCTPGYWRNHLEQWVFTGFAPGDSAEAVFGIDLNGALDGLTLEEAVNLGGGGLRKVLRHGTAGLLSAAHPSVDYPFTVAEVIAFVQAGDIDAVAEANESFCPIN